MAKKFGRWLDKSLTRFYLTGFLFAVLVVGLMLFIASLIK